MTTGELLDLFNKNRISVICGALSLALGAGLYYFGDEIPTKEAELARDKFF